MYKIIILPLAKDDIKKASKWYNKQQKDLGKQFSQSVRRTVKFIKNNPLAYSTRYENTKTAIVESFPYMLHYSIDDDNKIIIISSILHTSRNPEIWTNRNK